MQAALVLRLFGGMTRDSLDGELARAIASGIDAPEAERLLIGRFAARVRLYGLRHLGSEEAAQDLVQEVLLKVIVALRAGRLENPDSLASFVLGTCRHLVWDLRRAEQRARALVEKVGLEPEEEPSTARMHHLRLVGCLHRLPERELLIVRMSFTEDRSAEEIGTRLGLTAGNVRVIRHRALARLAICLGNEEDSS